MWLELAVLGLRLRSNPGMKTEFIFEGYKRERLLFLQLAQVMVPVAGTMGSRQGLVLWSSLWPKEKVVF